MPMMPLEQANFLEARKRYQQERDEKKAEQVRAFSTEAQSLRKLMSIYQPERKDEFTTMGLGDLRGESMAYAGKAAEAKARQETLKSQREEQSAKALEALLKQAGQTTPMSVPSSVMPGVFPDRTVGTRAPLTASRVRELLPDHPDAANSGNLVDLMRVLQAGDDEGGGGDPRVTDGPFGFKFLSDSRGRGTPQVLRPDKAAEGFIEVPDASDPVYGPKIRIPLSQAQKEYPHLLERLKGGGASVPASQFKSADDVKAAVKSGKLKKDEAVKILQTQFGYK